MGSSNGHELSLRIVRFDFVKQDFTESQDYAKLELDLSRSIDLVLELLLVVVFWSSPFAKEDSRGAETPVMLVRREYRVRSEMRLRKLATVHIKMPPATPCLPGV